MLLLTYCVLSSLSLVSLRKQKLVDRRKESGATGAVLVNPATDLAVICASRVREKLKKDQKPVRVDANPLLSSTMLCIKGMGWKLQQERRCRSEGQERAVKRHCPNLDCAGDVKDDTVGFCESVPWESLQRENGDAGVTRTRGPWCQGEGGERRGDGK